MNTVNAEINLTTEQLEALLEKRKAEQREKEESLRKQYEELKETTILSLIPQAVELSKKLKEFKELAFGEMDALYELLCSYSKRHADGKGNFSVEIADGLRINYKRQENGFFDERSNQAERHIIDFVNSHFKNDSSTKELITNLLERKKGKLDIKLVQKLYKMENTFEDSNWREGIKLLKESWTPSESRSYILFEVKLENEEWETINLNFASI